MANEVSSYMLRLVVECGEYFGVPREEMLAQMEDPSPIEKRWGSISWTEFYRIMQRILRNAGSGEELVAAGRRYRLECYRDRSDFLCWQYLSWEKMVWITKNFLIPRTVKGSDLFYQKIDKNRFHIRLVIPGHYQSDTDLMYLYFGVMTGNSPNERVYNETENLVITPHSAEFDIRFGQRSLHGRLRWNPFHSHRKAQRELEEGNEELLHQQTQLKRETIVLQKAFEAVSDCVFVLREGSVVRSNQQGQTLLKKCGPDRPSFLESTPSDTRLLIGGIPYLVRGNRTLAGTDGSSRMVTLRDLSREEDLRKRRLESRDRERSRTLEELESQLGDDLRQIRSRLSALSNQNSPASSPLQRILELTDTCIAESRPTSLSSSREIRCSQTFEDELRELVRDFTENFSYPVSLAIKEHPTLPRESDWAELFLLLQEGLRNSWRHARGNHANLTIEADRIELWDDGTGLDFSHLHSGGIGLASMLARCKKTGFEAILADPPRNGWIFQQKQPCGK